MKTNNQVKTCPNCGEDSLHKTKEKRRGKYRWVCHHYEGGQQLYCYSTVNPDKPVTGHNNKPTNVAPRKKFKRKIDHRRIIFTAAQNATPVHQGFWNALNALANDIDAERAVIPLRYKNATSMWTESQQNSEHWLRDIAAQELAENNVDEDRFYREYAAATDMTWEQYLDNHSKKYLYEQRKKFNDNIVVVGDVKVQPTMDDPLTGMEGFTQGESGIFGHTKMRLKCVATPQGHLPKILTTTGACTVPNYTDSKAGKKGEFHHVLGAVILEIKSRKKFYLHHVNATDDGTFIFKRRMYHPNGTVTDAPRAKAMIFGDAHYRFADPQVVEATFGEGGLVDLHDPEILVWHDLLDCYFGNPHHHGNPFIKKAKHSAGFHVAEDEVRETVEWMQELSAGRPSFIVASNHDDMFARWVIREDWKELDPENMEFYLETALQMARSAKMSDVGAEYLDPFGYWVERLVESDDPITPLRKNQSLMVGGNELSYHGDKGPGGARGTIKNLSRIGVKVVSGHGHSPAMQDGHTRTGTMTRLTAEYVDGPNDWLNAHATIDALNKRQLHICIDGSFYLD